MLLNLIEAWVVIGLSFALFSTFVTRAQIAEVCSSKREYVTTLLFLIFLWPVVLLFKARN